MEDIKHQLFFGNRAKRDYDAYVSFEKDEVLDIYKDMIDFIEKIAGLLQNHTT